MSALFLHLPLDFEQREDVRTLARLLASSWGGSGDTPAPLAEPEALRKTEPRIYAALCALRIWCDWGRAGTEWRPLQTPRGDSRDWRKENISYLIEDLCQWTGEPGALISMCLQAGVLGIEARGDVDGLTLTGFAEANPHLLPGYKSLQQQGGIMKAERARQKQTEQAAAQQSRILEEQGVLLFQPAEAVTEDEQRKVIALVMGFDMAAGRSIRKSSEYVADKPLLRDALLIVRRVSWEAITLVQRYLAQNRANPEVVKEMESVLRNFDELLRKAKS